MSTGNDTQDFRHTESTPSGAIPNVGNLWQRIWNGGDRTKPPPPVFTGTIYHVTDRVTGQVRLVRKGRWLRPPKRARAAGEHYYSMSLVSSSNPLVTWNNKYAPSEKIEPYVWYDTVESQMGLPSFTSPWTSLDDLALIGKLREKVSGGSFNAAVFVAEGHEALQLIFGAAKSLDKAYRQAKAGNFVAAGKTIVEYEKSRGRSGKAAAKTIGKNWLKNQFGIQPLLNDVHEAAQTAAHFASYPLQQTYTVTRKKDGTVKNPAPTAYVYLSSAGFTAKKIKAVVSEVDVPQLLGLTDPASVIWEKVPYSFVVDWFVPIGNYLSARGLSQALTGVFVTTTTTRWHASGVKLAPAPYQGRVLGSGWASYKKRVVTVDRTVSSSLFVPLPEVKPFGKTASWSHAASAVSLLLGHVK